MSLDFFRQITFDEFKDMRNGLLKYSKKLHFAHPYLRMMIGTFLLLIIVSVSIKKNVSANHSLCSIYLILISDGNSEHVAHALRKISHFKEKIRFVTTYDLIKRL